MAKETELLKFTSKEGEITLPLARVKGKKEGKRVVISAGIHGCEYASINAVIRLYQELDPEKLSGEVDIVTIANLPAFEGRVPFVCPVDGKNPNRVCPGNPDGSFTEALVYHLLNDIVKGADAYMDLHCGDLIEAIEPFSLYHAGGDEKIEEASRKLAETYGIEDIIVTRNDTSWPDYYTTYANGSALGVPSITAECGGFGQTTEKDLEAHLGGLYRVLSSLDMVECPKAYEPKPVTNRVFDNFIWVYSPVAGLYMPEATIGDEVEKGQRLGYIADYFGNEKYILTAPEKGRILFVETTLSIGDNGLVLAIGKYKD